MTLPKSDKTVETSNTDKPVTQTALVEVKKASMKDSGAPVVDAGNMNSNAPMVMRTKYPKTTTCVGWSVARH